jgi:hypothetical protein
MGLLVRTKSFHHLEVSVYTLPYDNVVRYDSRLVRGITRGIRAVPLLRPDHLPAAAGSRRCCAAEILRYVEAKPGRVEDHTRWRYRPIGGVAII